jgi:hypothetical protein
LLNRAQLGNHARSLIIAKGPELATLANQLLVALEPVCYRAEAGSASIGPPVVHWAAE